MVIGGKEDAALGETIVARRAEKSAKSAVGASRSGESAALLKRAALLVTNDSAPLHLATAVGTPILAIFDRPCRRSATARSVPATGWPRSRWTVRLLLPRPAVCPWAPPVHEGPTQAVGGAGATSSVIVAAWSASSRRRPTSGIAGVPVARWRRDHY